MEESQVNIIPIIETYECRVAFIETAIAAGFPSPCQDYMDGSIDFNKELIRNPAATFCAKVSGNSMIGEGIEDGDILVVDRSLHPCDGKIVVSFIDGEFTLKRLRIDTSGVWLQPANPAYPAIRIEDGNNFKVWGVVTYVIKRK
ncbi:MAG: translesion error-prone DNA polymerase V autoproteolytic subunit [Anaerovoracaceae bacterium]